MIGMTGKTLASPRLTCRLLDGQDRQALACLLDSRAVTEPAGFLPAENDEAFDRFFQSLTAYRSALAVLRNGELIGYIHVNPYRSSTPPLAGRACVGLGFVIGSRFQRQGLGSEMLEMVTRYLKERFDYCVCDHFSDNLPSQKLIEGRGYQYLEEYEMYFEELGAVRRCLSYYR
ncbi:MAG: GNAT family N-acetyltransferase [Oscillospiraceae bacterium]|nr:GNAT family N-acetyltransferase [Oscillospiraceae bacterium]